MQFTNSFRMNSSIENKPLSPVPPPKPPKRRTVEPPSVPPVNEVLSPQNQENGAVKTDEPIEKGNGQLVIKSSPPPPPARSRPRPSPAPPSLSPTPLAVAITENTSVSPTKQLQYGNDDNVTPSSSSKSPAMYGVSDSTKSSSIDPSFNEDRKRVVKTKAGNSEESILSGMLSKRNREGKFDKCLFTLTATSLLYQKLLPTTQELEETPVVEESSCKSVPVATILVG
jgi:hypothetical protein